MQALAGFSRSLSGKLLIFTVIFVMLAEILIFVPSVARYRRDFLLDKLDKAQIAVLSVQASAADGLHPDLEAELLRRSGVLSVAVAREGRRHLMLAAPTEGSVAVTFDLREGEHDVLSLIIDALACAFQFEDRLIGVVGDTTLDGASQIHVVIEESTLKNAMLAYGWRIFLLSLVISGITAVLVFVTVHRFLVRPIRRVIDSLMSFREDPEDAGRIIAPSGARGEIGDAERELAEQQRAVAKALQQKSRLAALGAAVAKINHDLRNILASAQLLADRLAESRDPSIARIGPKIVGSLDRAIRLCKQTLAYGRAEEPPPEFARVDVGDLASEVAAALDLAETWTAGRVNGARGVEDALSRAPRPGAASARRSAQLEADAELQGGPNETPPAAAARDRIAFFNGVPGGLAAVADPDQLFRALLNLVRNAQQAIDATGKSGVIAIEARRLPGDVEIDVVDNGPGLPEKTKDNLFKAFKGSVRKGGTGLGMAIAAELVRAQGGELSLVASSADGARFRIRLPDRADPATAAQGEGGGGRRAARRGKGAEEPAAAAAQDGGPRE